MTIYDILIAMLERPQAPQNYRHLQAYYTKNHKTHEATVIGFLIENKFTKNNDSTHNSNTDSQ
jgi:hypothetical protein